MLIYVPCVLMLTTSQIYLLLLLLLLFTDMEKPLFIGCPKESVYVKLFEVVTVPSPNVEDNSGAVKTFTVEYNLNRPVTRGMTLTWTAADHAGNMAEHCVIRVHVKGWCSNII